MVAISGVRDFGYLVDTICAKLRLRPSLNQRLRRRIERSLFDDHDIWDRLAAGTSAGCDLLIVHNAIDDIVNRGQAGLLATGYGDRTTVIETTSQPTPWRAPHSYGHASEAAYTLTNSSVRDGPATARRCADWHPSREQKKARQDPCGFLSGTTGWNCPGATAGSAAAWP